MLNVSLLKPLSLAAVATLALAPTAEAFSLNGSISAQEFENRNVDVAMSPESRWGDGGVNASEHEVNVHTIEDGWFSNYAQDNYRWKNGEAVDFSVVFDGIKTLTYTVGNTVLETQEVEDNFSDLYLRTAAYRAGSSMTLSNLTFENGGGSSSVDDVASECDSGCGFFDASYYHIGDISGAFTLTGQSTMSWDTNEQLPTRSRLGYQVKLVYGDDDTADVPEPGMLLGFAGLAVGAIAGRKQRERQQA